MKYLAVLGRLPDLSRIELETLYYIKTLAYLPPDNHPRHPRPAILTFEHLDDSTLDLSRLGGTIKLAQKIEMSPLDYLRSLPDGKITLGVSDYSAKPSGAFARDTAMNLKKKLSRQAHRSVRVVNSNYQPAISSATAHHNHLGEKPTHVELIYFSDGATRSGEWFVSLGTQNITAYARRDQARPARDAKVGMLPPKLAQILINLCGPLPEGSRILDPFCGTGVLLQEALLMGYTVIGTDLNERMIKYSKCNLEWLSTTEKWILSVGDATTSKWHDVDAVACETYLGPPLSTPPSEIKLKEIKHECREIILGFLKNLSPQLKGNTPVVVAAPAWLRPDGTYSGLNILDEIAEVGYNVIKYNNILGEAPLLYYREGQVVAREIIVLRKK